tara:strand:+ start:1948 stop:2427 length:480 start_codon:yes stop_codon:yes gene_type:complete
MKNLLVLLTFALFISCGNSEEKKKGFKYNRTQKEEKKDTANDVSEVPIDLNNKGIGPIKSLTFDEEIDQAMAAKGDTVFKQKCTACHMAERKLIGPAMKGIYERRSPEWVINILLNPTEMLKQDPIAKALLKKYNNVMMLNQNLSEEEARAISEYLRTL